MIRLVRKYLSTELLFATAACLALAAALVSALRVELWPGAGQTSAAMVNGRQIPLAEYERALSAMQAGLKRPLTAQDRERALDLLIDEELIVQRALELDLASSDRMTRKMLVQALLRYALALDLADTPTDSDLRDFYDEEIALFSAPLFVSVRIAAASDPATGDTFATRLAQGEAFDEVLSATGLTDFSPPANIPVYKLADYAGMRSVEAVEGMAPGDILGPVEYGDKDLFIWLTGREGGSAVPFEDARDLVAAEWQRRQEERAIAAYTRDLRQQADIDRLIRPGEPAGAAE